MPAKKNARKLLTAHLGKDVADAVLAKIDTMVKEGASPAKIERAVQVDISNEIEKQVYSAVLAQIGPIQPIRIKPIQVSIKPAVKPVPSIQVSSGISVAIEPPVYARGTRSGQ